MSNVASFVKFRSDSKLVDDIINNVPRTLVVEKMFDHSLHVYCVHVIDKGDQVLIKIGDNMGCYTSIQEFLSNTQISYYALIKRSE